MDSLFPTAKIYSPHGQNYDVGRPRPAAVLQGGQDRRRSCTRASPRPARWRRWTAVGTSYATHGEPDDPDLHLLLDVRLPAHRRRVLGGRRPAGARLRARRDRRPHDAQRRGPAARGRPLAAARVDQPGVRLLRPGVRLRGRAHRQGRRCAGCTASKPEDVFYYLTVYNEPYAQPAEPEDVDVEGILRGHLPLRARAAEGDAAAGADPRLRRRGAVGAGGAAAARRGLGRRGRRLVGDVVERAAPRGAGRATSTTS